MLIPEKFHGRWHQTTTRDVRYCEDVEVSSELSSRLLIQPEKIVLVKSFFNNGMKVKMISLRKIKLLMRKLKYL